ncbi:MAG: DUF2254 domain-containing protein [Chloroflexi bacterium]|nr:DUF2254 domain-containing protein [Chloroflexota bacterium]
MRIIVIRAVEYLRESLWFLPGLAFLVAIILHQSVLQLDRSLDREISGWLRFDGGAESARSFLSTIATSILSMTAVTFSVTMLVLQLASGQLSPRVIRSFLRDRRNQVVLALFISTFAYALLTLRVVRHDFIPGITIWVAFLLVLVSIGAFIFFINHIAQSVRVSTVIDGVARETLATMDRLYPEDLGEPASEAHTVFDVLDTPPQLVVRWDRRSGIVTGVDVNAILSLSDRHTCTIAIVPRVGDFVARDSIVARAWGDVEDVDVRLLRQAIAAGLERSMRQDAAFGMRQLVDIAERALSPGVNDPTTAVQVLDQLHDLLAVLMVRAIPSPYRAAADGDLRVYMPRPGWDQYVALALDEIREYGATSSQVQSRLRLLLDDLLDRAPATRRPALLRQLEQLNSAAD